MKKTKEYWMNWAKAAGVRAIKTVSQSAIAAIGASAMISEVDWVVVASTAVLAGIVSILTRIAGLPGVSVPENVEG